MLNFRNKNFKTAAIGLAIILASIFTVFLYTKNQQDLSGEAPQELPEELPQEQNTLVSVGYVEQTQLTLDNGDKVPMFIQAYGLRDEYGNILDLLNVQSVEMKYPGGEEFLEVGLSSLPNGAIFSLGIWPPDVLGEYIFRIEYEDGTIREETVNWQGILFKPSTPTLETRIENDGTSLRAYEIQDLNLSSFEEMYHIRPNSSVRRIERPQGEYFWLKTPDAMIGNHILLIKKDGIWYQSSILIVSEEIRKNSGL